MMKWLGELLGLEGLDSIVSLRVQYVSPWAHNRPVLVLLLCLAMAALSAVFYVRYQTLRGRKSRISMAIFRAVLLGLLVWILAEPEAVMEVKHHPRPLLLVLFDGTDSMNMHDKISGESRKVLQAALGDESPKFSDEKGKGPTRQDLVRAAIRSGKLNWLAKLSGKFRLRGFVLDQVDQVREIPMPQLDSDDVDAASVAKELAGCAADVTALGVALADLKLRGQSHLLAGVVVVSDFNQNRHQQRLPVDAAKELNVRVHTVGVGPTKAVDLAVRSIQSPLVLKKGEKAGVTVELHQIGLDERKVDIELLARPVGAAEGERFREVARARGVSLNARNVTRTVTYEPMLTGRFTLRARVEALDEEVLQDNNAAEREVTIRDESLKLLFIESEPTWEWRFMKEVFHRDPMIGREGFRTYLETADYTVRQSNELFVQALQRSRAEFFSYDVIFLSDIPARILTSEFQKMLKEYVSKFGGGLVVLAGPRYGPAALIDAKIADMLPVVTVRGLRRRDGQFDLRLTPQAGQYDFMTLEEDDYRNTEAWGLLRRLQWYQPSLRPHPLATVLADHPRHYCEDDKTPQPLIAIRRYGKGEVVYFAFNETWRLRKFYGEKYYSRLWGQLIYRMGLSRALGSQKRFKVQTNRPRYRPGQKVDITVEAYNEKYNPLRPEIVSLSARLLVESAGDEPKSSEKRLNIPRSRGPLSRPKVIFETSVKVSTAGLHTLLVTDPVTGKETVTTFKVAPTVIERRSALRNVALQRQMAQHTEGKSYELHEIGTMAEDISDRPVEEIAERRFPLWNTWLVLGLGVALMLGEWLTRKLLNLQ